MEKALFYEKGKGGCHLVSPHKLKKICPAIIQVSDWIFSRPEKSISTIFQDQSLYVFCRSEEEKLVEEAEKIVSAWFEKRGWLKNVELEPKRKISKTSN